MAKKKLTKEERVGKAWAELENLPEMLEGINETDEGDVRMYAEDCRRCGQAALDTLDGKKK